MNIEVLICRMDGTQEKQTREVAEPSPQSAPETKTDSEKN